VIRRRTLARSAAIAARSSSEASPQRPSAHIVASFAATERGRSSWRSPTSLQDELTAGVGGDPHEPWRLHILSDEEQVAHDRRDATLVEGAGAPKVKVDSAAISEDEPRRLTDRFEVLHQTRRGGIARVYSGAARCHKYGQAAHDDADGALLQEGVATKIQHGGPGRLTGDTRTDGTGRAMPKSTRIYPPVTRGTPSSSIEASAELATRFPDDRHLSQPRASPTTQSLPFERNRRSKPKRKAVSLECCMLEDSRSSRAPPNHLARQMHLGRAGTDSQSSVPTSGVNRGP
jgi:hypothetical protein